MRDPYPVCYLPGFSSKPISKGQQQYKDPRKNKENKDPLRTVSKDKSNMLIRKSTLTAAVPRTYGKALKRKTKSLSPGSSDEENTRTNTASTLTPKSSSEVMFMLPPKVDFPDPPRLTSSSARRTSFISPDDLVPSSSPPPPEPFLDPSTLHFEIYTPPRERVCKYCHQRLPSKFNESPPSAPRARYAYCQRHMNATTLEEGISKGFPESVDFMGLRKRVRKLLPLIQKILDSSESEFLTNLRKKTFRKTAAAPMSLINVFDDSQPGYYGSYGAEVIAEVVLNKLGDEIRGRDDLFDTLKFCGGVTGYVSAVLVPEVGLQLIMEDMNISQSEAREVMKESVAYGGALNANMDSEASEDSDDNDEDSY